MNGIPCTDNSRIQALERLGYTEREARFLALIALQSGYFLRRHYATFTGQADGGSMAQLIEKLINRNHAEVLTFHHKTQVYHVNARPFYATLGEGDNRNRRRHEPLTIKNKLMIVDFVLAHASNRYLVTEREKVHYFTGVLQIDTAGLPHKVYRKPGHDEHQTARYFVEKFPVFLPPFCAANDDVAVSFCFVDEGSTTLSGFETFLMQYRPLFMRLPRFEVVYVAQWSTHCEKARTAFGRFLVGEKGNGRDVSGANLKRLLDHFEARRLYDEKQFAQFDRARLIRLRNETAEFSGTRHEMLYGLWRTAGADALTRELDSDGPLSGRMNGSFSTYLLQHSYDLFGQTVGL